jgi:hypothetical protein
MTYFAGRALPIILIGFLIYLALFQRAIFKHAWWRYLVAFVIAVLIALPMFIEIARTPGAEKRTEVVGGPLIELRNGNIKPAIETTIGTLGMFTFAGDPESLYNISGRPVFDWITGLFFYVGVVLCIIRLKRVESGFALTWLLIGIGPAFVSLPAASFSHTLAAQPVVYMLTAYGVIGVAFLIGKLIERGKDRAIERISPLLILSIALSVILVAIGGWLTIRDYFGVWAHDEFVRFQYHGPTRDIAKWLDQHPEITDVAIGTHPNELVLDPLALRLDLTREDVNARWFNAESSLVLSGMHPVVLSAMQSPGEEVQSILSTMGWLENKQATFEVYSTMPLFGALYPPGGAFDHGRLVFLGGGAQPLAHQARPGQLMKWGVTWRIQESLSSLRLKLFLHVLNDKGEVIAGDDREDVNFATLKAGDDFWQFGQLILPNNVPPGQYQVEIGWYNPETGERLKRDDGSDRFLLDPIEVIAP